MLQLICLTIFSMFCITLSFRQLLGILEHIAKYKNEYNPLQNIEIKKPNKWRHIE